jgi:ferredoxin
MAYIVGDPCVKCKYTDCVEVCPVECFYEGANSLVINPDECIDCGACEPECPSEAIFEESALPEEMNAYITINNVFSGVTEPADADTEGWPEKLVDFIKGGDFAVWPVITERKDALAGADDVANDSNKIEDFDPKGPE